MKTRISIWMSIILVSSGLTATAYDEAAPEDPTPRLVLTWQDPEGLFRLGSERVGRYVKNILEPAGVETVWKTGAVSASADPTAVQVRVVLLPSEPATWGLSSNAMGVCLSRTWPQNAVYLFLPPVARTLGHAPRSPIKNGASMQLRIELARALSRVVAHEIIHAVAPGLDHASGGVTQDSLDGVWLREGTERFIHPRAAEVFRRELRKLSSPTAHPEMSARVATTDLRPAIPSVQD